MFLIIEKLKALAAVVHKRGDAQHPDVRPRELVQHPELSEQLNAKVKHLLAVRGVETHIVDIRRQAVPENIAYRFFQRLRHGVIEHIAFAQTAPACGDDVEIHIINKRLYDGQRAREHVRPRGGHTLDFHFLVQVEHLYHVIDVVKIRPRHLIVVHHVERIFFDAPGYFRKAAERPAHADKLRVRIDFFEPCEFFEFPFDEFFYFKGLIFRSFLVHGKHFAERDRAERQNALFENIPSVVIYKFGASAADFHDEPFRNLHGVYNALIDIMRLFRFRQNAQFDARRHENVVEKHLLASRLSDRGGRHRDYFVDVVALAGLLENFKRRDSLYHPRRFKRTVFLHVSQAHGFFHFIDNNVIAAVQYVDNNQSCGI